MVSKLNLKTHTVYKILFSLFWAVSSVFDFSANMIQKHYFFKNAVRVSKNAEFDADFESVEKLKNFYTKKLLSKSWRKYALFFTFTHVHLYVLQITFCVNFFGNFSMDLKPAWNSAFFDTHIEYKNNKILPNKHFLLTKKRIKKTKSVFYNVS